MKVAILSANLGDFDTAAKDPIKQTTEHEITFHRFTDNDFPPIAGLTSRMQYRIPKCFGWEMLPGYDIYIWLDASMSLQREDSVEWLLGQLGTTEMAFFRHPWRKTMQEEVEHIEQKIKEDNKYIVSRYKGGLHREMLDKALSSHYFNNHFKDTNLYASNVFIYRNSHHSRKTLEKWWFLQSRYFTCDQVNLPYALWLGGTVISKINENVFKTEYISLVSHHK